MTALTHILTYIFKPPILQHFQAAADSDVQDVEYDTEFDSWKCRITGKSLDDDVLTFITAIDVKANAVFCVTVF